MPKPDPICDDPNAGRAPITCPQCGGPMLNLGWLDIDVWETACPKCDREKFLALGWDPEGAGIKTARSISDREDADMADDLTQEQARE